MTKMFLMITLVILVFSNSAFAAKTIVCHETSSDYRTPSLSLRMKGDEVIDVREILSSPITGKSTLSSSLKPIHAFVKGEQIFDLGTYDYQVFTLNIRTNKSPLEAFVEVFDKDEIVTTTIKLECL